LGTEGTVVQSMSEMNLKRKSVSIDAKLAAIKLLGEGESVGEVALKLAISIETVQKKKRRRTY
jgi:DNA-binding CsgD family transcriptional regulator